MKTKNMRLHYYQIINKYKNTFSKILHGFKSIQGSSTLAVIVTIDVRV